MLIASLVLGILSIVLSGVAWLVFWWLSIVGLVLGAISIILAVVGKNKLGKWDGLSIGGLVCSIIGIINGLSGIIVYFSFMNALM